ncbi:MAG: hypothetical protein KDD64_14175 [Bdellovibrionales bacterium]|nr:hypothetical protein [Bdellovibrionales bacterium]
MGKAALRGLEDHTAFEMNENQNNGRRQNPLSELMRAVFLLAIHDLYGGREKRESAMQFILSDDEEHVFSFHSICNYFGMDPLKARARILDGDRVRTRRRNW